ncbi:MAG: DNA repair exonuclease, partial [Thaumarchaeota archaeon]|nr:DNA repair exonuclease [Nitrososphaerota archaeon]
MYSFAHLSDCHLGFQKNESLKKIEQQVFEKAIDECIKRKVDFILIPGDLFHVNIPDMDVVKFAIRNFKKVYDAGIPVYVVYGSHDFSPVAKSAIDLLTETGYLTKVSKQKESSGEKIQLEFTTDQKTGAKLVGLPGLTAGKELTYYENLDTDLLKSQEGFKIFLFHAGLNELKSQVSAETDFMPLSLLPKGFDYYAGGHMHTHSREKYPEYGHVVYPGTLFAGFHSDLEEN